MSSDPIQDPRLTRRRPSDKELERESEITPSDIDAAIASFNRHAPPEARGLLEAEPEGEE